MCGRWERLLLRVRFRQQENQDLSCLKMRWRLESVFTAVMINGSGATPLMELFIINNHVADVLAEKGIRIYRTLVGEYMTSIEMQGFSISLLKLDEEMKQLLDAEADTPAWKE